MGGAVLRLVPDVADHAAGASCAMSLLAGYRAHAEMRAALVRQPCDYCGRRQCNKLALLNEWHALKVGDAPKDMIDLAEGAYLLALQRCHGSGPFGLIRDEDLVEDEHGHCALDHADELYDRVRERSKERM